MKSPTPKTTAKVPRFPDCDVCGSVAGALYDGRTIHGPWAYMCEKCWKRIGVGRLGEGFAQKLEV
jgi:hypothetical protein